MKKVLIGLAVISALAFAKGGRGSGIKGGDSTYDNKNYNNQKGIYYNLSEEEQGKLSKLREEHRTSLIEKNLEVKEARIQIEKELLKDTVDWKAVEKLVDEEYKERAEMELLRLKYRSMIREEFDSQDFDYGRHMMMNYDDEHMNYGGHMNYNGGY